MFIWVCATLCGMKVYNEMMEMMLFIFVGTNYYGNTFKCSFIYCFIIF